VRYPWAKFMLKRVLQAVARLFATTTVCFAHGLFSLSRRFALPVISYQTTRMPAYRFITMGICDVI
jgi:hypothetical protein